jgi:signal transduction histidine kinase
VLAADSERRRIERELHDGAQQHLVALAVNVQLARQLVDGDRAAARALLEEIGHDVRATLESVRELAQRIYPPLLLDRGLAEALRGAASEAAVEARVEVAEIGRFAPEVESAVYFCCLEALRTAATHPGAGGPVTIRVWRDEGALHFEVSHGAGFDRPDGREHAGLTAMGDRLGALGGRLTASSKDGLTCISGTLPLS